MVSAAAKLLHETNVQVLMDGQPITCFLYQTQMTWVFEHVQCLIPVYSRMPDCHCRVWPVASFPDAGLGSFFHCLLHGTCLTFLQPMSAAQKEFLQGHTSNCSSAPEAPR
jgi:hypothetical protein